jgi:UDP:flavonoid glycosyltransferase YjiC (YdhE family)
MNENSSLRKKPRIVFFSEAVTLAHLVRPVHLAAALQKTGNYEIFIASPGDKRYELCFAGTDFKRVPITVPTFEEFMRRVDSGALIFDRKTLDEHVEEDLLILDSLQPDLVVGDLRLSLSVSGLLKKVPYVAISNAYWSPYSARSRFPIPDIPLTRLFGARLSQPVFDAIWPLISYIQARPFNQVRKKHGLPGLQGWLDVYTHADHVVYADVPMLAPTASLPPNHHYLGAIPWSPPVALPTWWNDIDPRKPCIYLSLGSSGKAGLLPDIIAALADMDANLLVATAGRISLDALPANAFGAEYLPGAECAAKADVVICNGGSPTIQQALCEGTPVLGIPANMDQYLSMEEACHVGAGLLIRSIEASGTKVRRHVSQLLGDSRYRATAERVKAEIRSMDADKIFCDLIGQLLGIPGTV